MPHVRIESSDDERVVMYRDLRGAANRRSELFVVEGRLLVERLISSSYTTHSILVDQRRLSWLDSGSQDGLSELPVFVADSEVMHQILGFEFHRGILACGYRRAGPTLLDVCDRFTQTALLLACVNVQDPTNLGGVLRSSAALGVDAVLVGQQSADPFARRAIRVSMGASLQLQVVQCQQLLADLTTLQTKHGFELIATAPAGGEPLESAARRARTVVLFGSESDGLPPAALELADRCLSIPMAHQTDSLNVATAASVFLYHFTRVARSI